MLWLGKARTRQHDEAWRESYLSNNIGRGISPAQWDEIRQADRQFAARKPSWSEACLVCDRRHGWVEAQDEDGRRWVCAKCHRPQMSEADAREERQRLHQEAAQQAAQAAAAKAAASTPSATRQALQAAIQRRDAAVAEVVRLEAARRQLIDTGHEAFLASEAAEAGLKALRTTTTDMLVATALGNAPAGPQKTLRQAEQDAVDAKQRRADADAAQKEIEKRLADAKHSAKWASDGVRTAALAAIGANSAGSVRAYITETARIQRELADRLRAMEWLKAGDLLTLDEATQAVMQNFMEPTRKWPSPDTSTVARWEAVVTALSTDPKARASIG